MTVKIQEYYQALLEQCYVYISSLKSYIDKQNMHNKLLQMEQAIKDPNLWNDPNKAVSVKKQYTYYESIIQEYKKSQTMLNDIHLFIDQGAEYIEVIEEYIENIYASLKQRFIETLFTTDEDSNDCFLTVQSGVGGVEAQDWAQMLLRMYIRYSEKHGYKTELIDINYGHDAGIKSATIKITNDTSKYAYGYMKAEHGVHRLVRMSPFNAQGKRQTSFASVSVLPCIDRTISININPKELRIDTYRAQGAGGQHVNTTDSAVRITHIPTGITTQSQTQRSQHQNKEEAMQMLQSKLHALESAKQRATLPNNITGGIEWGAQIRSYTLQPKQIIKDLRTNHISNQADKVLDGDIQDFIQIFLIQQISPNNTLGK